MLVIGQNLIYAAPVSLPENLSIMTSKKSIRNKKHTRRLPPQVPSIENMVEHLRIKDLWYTTFIRDKNNN